MAGINRPQLARLVELDRAIRRNTYPNCSSFAKDYEVSPKTVQRDLDFLRDTWGAPLDYDAKERGYYYTDATWSFPTLNLTEAELAKLLVAERMAEQYRGTPIAKTIETIFDKLSAKLDGQVSFDPVYLGARFSFYGQPTRPLNEKTWVTLFRGIKENRVIEAAYMNQGEGPAKKRKIEPIHLASLVGEWYLVAFDQMREQVRHFTVAWLESTKLTRKNFEPHEFDKEKYFENRFGRFVGRPDEYETYVIKFSKEVAHWIEEREWQPKQKIKRHRDGSLTLTFPAPSAYEVKRWVLQWGKDAVLLEPESVRKEMKAEILKMKMNYIG